MKRFICAGFMVLAVLVASAFMPWPTPSYAADAVASKASGTYQHPFVGFINRTAVGAKSQYSVSYDVKDYKRKTVYMSGFKNNTSGGKQARLVRQVSYSNTGPWFDNWSSTGSPPFALIDDDYEYQRFLMKDATKPVTVHFRLK